MPICRHESALNACALQAPYCILRHEGVGKSKLTIKVDMYRTPMQNFFYKSVYSKFLPEQAQKGVWAKKKAFLPYFLHFSTWRSHSTTVTHLYFIVRNVMADILTFIQKTKILTGWGSKKHFRVKNSQFQLSKMRLFKINISQLFFNIQKPFCLRWKAICKIYNFY